MNKHKPITVLKFGGTSVKSIGRIRHVSEIVQERSTHGPLLVVVSAMGDTTDYLIKLAKRASESPDAREMDQLLAVGEQISITLLTMTLHSMGIKAKSLTAYQVGIFTESVHNKARIVDLKTDSLLNNLGDNEVLVVAGFQGITEAGDLTTLGRGGSDTTAVALAAAVNASSCDIYTDVDGIYSADPNLIEGARLLTTVSYEEVLEMARLGAQVIHPRAVELARQYNVKLRVRNTFKPENQGTLITGGSNMEIYRAVSGVAMDKDQASVAIINVPDKPGIAGTIMQTLATENIVIDMIMQAFHPTIGKNSITFTVHQDDLDKTIAALNKIKGELGASEVLSDPDIAKVSLIGAGLAAQPGVAAKVFNILGQNQINIKMIATSEMKLTCVIGKNDAQKATQLIHDAFELQEAVSQ